jgi:regulator of sirC expression with transglutaminase-like and TPR domain
VISVEAEKIADAERKALAALLDDPSPAVRQALRARFAERGKASADFLQELARQSDSAVAKHASQYLRELNFTDPVSEFREFIHSLNYELETGAILLARTVNPNVDVGAVCLKLDAMAARCRELIAEPATAREKCRVLNRVLFHENGLHGNADNYSDPLNSFLDQVLIRRKGIPISLSIVYLLVAERVGLQLEPVGLPGHFMVGCFEESPPFFIDTFNAGMLLDAEETFGLLKDGAADASIIDLAPTPVREVLSRCCRNLVRQYTATEQSAQAQLFGSFVADFEAAYERNTS